MGYNMMFKCNLFVVVVVVIKADLQKGETKGELSIHCFTPQMAAKPGAENIWCQESLPFT